MNQRSVFTAIRWLFIIIDVVILGILIYLWHSWYSYYKQLPAQPPTS